LYSSHKQDDIVNKDKGNVVSVHAMKAYKGCGPTGHSFLTAGIDGGEQSASYHSYFTTRKESQVLIKQETGWGQELVWTF
jgi:hypothetical protein